MTFCFMLMWMYSYEQIYLMMMITGLSCKWKRDKGFLFLVLCMCFSYDAVLSVRSLVLQYMMNVTGSCVVLIEVILPYRSLDQVTLNNSCDTVAGGSGHVPRPVQPCANPCFSVLRTVSTSVVLLKLMIICNPSRTKHFLLFFELFQPCWQPGRDGRMKVPVCGICRMVSINKFYVSVFSGNNFWVN